MLRDDAAVTPTIGEILMVSVTVLMAAVVVAYALGIGPSKTAPKTSISAVGVDVAQDYVKLTHQGGDSLSLYDTKVTVEQKNERIIWTKANRSNLLVFTPGDSIYVYTNSSGKGIYLNGIPGAGQNLNAVWDSGSVDIVSGTGIKITIIDIPSNLVLVTTITP